MDEGPKKPSKLSLLPSLVVGLVPGLLTKTSTILVIIFALTIIIIIYASQWLYFLIKKVLFLQKQVNALNEQISKITVNRDGLKAERKKLINANLKLESKVGIQGKLIHYVITTHPELQQALTTVQKLEELSDVTGLSNRENY